ncbi:PREDICTED: uncharacterized protein LOC104595737 [Nelumbo nucifera]|uniref:Uncharacterized protein n=2 Tax=Nelumbo nucifera TaxID=4432 RepID=A0A822Z745_NELNU|nr:PREDICTED: uncharacterized protein LOC104595737 [Nelumbo nucifera]DAD40677.1 TPA_asm: hypothetical protein HUJ06_015000 [Nelumbo nucifera]
MGFHATESPGMKQRNPSWIFSLLSEKFFDPCLLHDLYSKKNEKNTFCLDCCISICPHCLGLHRSHCLLQIRRYVYHDVIRLDDMEKLFDCSSVQSYTTNSAKVVFLHQRSQSRPVKVKGSGGFCNTCDRSLQEPYQFCSLACKVEYLVDCDGCISGNQHECDFLPLSLSDYVCADIDGAKALKQGQMTPNSVLDSETMVFYRTPSVSSSSCTNGNVGCLTAGCTATTENVTRERGSTEMATATGSPYYQNKPRNAAASKRKGVPFRSPFY